MYAQTAAPLKSATLSGRAQRQRTTCVAAQRLAAPQAKAAAARAAPLSSRKAQALAGARGVAVPTARVATVSASRTGVDVVAFLNLFDKKKTVVITGASSGLGRATADVLANSGDWHVVFAIRDVEKTKEVIEELELAKGSYTIMPVDLRSLKDVSKFCDKVKNMGRPLHALVCNAAVYLPNQPGPTWTEEGFEESFGVNHLAHHLMVRKLLPELQKTKGRCIIVGSITGNTNTVGGGAVAPFANLGQLEGLKQGGKYVPMLDAQDFNGAKAYKDAKLCNMMTVLELHRRFHTSTGVIFSSMYPGCIAETALFRQKRDWFRKLFPLFMKYVTGAYVSEAEAGERLAQVVTDDVCTESGVYWSWNGGARTTGWYDFKKGVVVGAGGAGGEIFQNKPSGEVRNEAKASELFDLCDKLVAPYMKSPVLALPF